MVGKTLISDTNPDFGNIQHIHSHHAELYGLLSVFTFLQEYSKYYMLTFQSKVEYYCDNIEVVHKINTLSNNRNSFNEQHKTIDHDAVLQLKECLPTNVITFHGMVLMLTYNHLFLSFQRICMLRTSPILSILFLCTPHQHKNTTKIITPSSPRKFIPLQLGLFQR